MRFFVPGTGERGECDETKDKRYDKREAGRYHRFLCPSPHAGKRIPAAIYRDEMCIRDRCKTELEDIELKAVPYCHWGNRTTGEMLVWIKELL